MNCKGLTKFAND